MRLVDPPSWPGFYRLPMPWRLRLIRIMNWVSPTYIWWRFIKGPIFERYCRARFWLYRGIEGDWWCPATNEVVTTCQAQRGVVVAVDLADRSALVRCADGVERRFSWTYCLEPGWEGPDAAHGVRSRLRAR